MRRTLTAALLLAACSPALSQPGGDLVGIASVIDGDTIEVHGRKVRLSGFDAPEKGARCDGVNVSQKAAFALADKLGKHVVSCDLTGAKTYDREVGTCRVAGDDLGDFMASAGWARDWPRYSKGAYADEERNARAGKRGIWGMSCPADVWSNRNYD